jgi:hypothetical protein
LLAAGTVCGKRFAGFGALAACPAVSKIALMR